MSWMDKVGGLLKQYTSGSGAAAAPAPDVHAHFDQVAEAAPTSTIAEGLAAASFARTKHPRSGIWFRRSSPIPMARRRPDC